jgi:protein-S-isoprenylcysteine O-methyltransferase Ste14
MGTEESKQGGARVRIPPPLVFTGFIGLGIALRYGVGPLSVPLPRAAQLALGALFAAAAFALGGSAVGLFRRTGQDPAPWTPSPSLIAGGPYRFSRNPMYVSMVMLEVAIGLFLGNLWVVLLAAPALAIVHFTAVVREEAYLEERFGDPYRKYKAEVRRYL